MKRFRWVVIFMIFVASMINYLDRSALSYAIKPLQDTFGLTNTDFGIVAAAFGIGYLIMTLIGGVLVDTYGARKIWTISAVFWSIACACIGLATGFASIFIFRMILGLGEGPAFPALTRVSADWLPVKERVRAMAFGLAAVPFASVLGAPLLSQLIASYGWRMMFFILGFVGILWAIAWHWIFRDRPSQSPYVSQAELQHINNKQTQPISTVRTSWRFMLLNPTLLVNNYAFFSFGYLLFFAITWLPGYLEQTYHMQLKTIGWFLIAPWLTATVFILLGGIISDMIWSKTKSIRQSRSHIIWVCQVLSVICFIPVLITHSIIVVAIGISLGVGFGLMPNAAFYAINADLAHDRAGTSQGVMTCSFALSGIIAPLVTGWLSSLTGNFSVAIIVMMALTFSSAILIVLFQRPD